MSSQIYANVPLSGNYTEHDKEKLQKLIFNAVRTAEEEYKLEEDKGANRVRVSYVLEPKSAKDFSEAKRIKCIVYSFSNSGEVKYGACVFRRNDGFSFDDASTVKSDRVSNSTTRTTKKGDVFKKKNVRSTATSRYEKCPVRFSMQFRDIYKKVPSVTEKNGSLVEGSDYTLVSKEEQVVEKIKQMMCDKEHGGVRGKKVKQTFQSIQENTTEDIAYEQDGTTNEQYGVQEEMFEQENTMDDQDFVPHIYISDHHFHS